MRSFLYVIPMLLIATVSHAQCFSRVRSCDANMMEIRSQLNVSFPVVDKTTSSDAFKAVEDARRQLSSLQDRELEALKSIYGNETTLKSSSVNSNMQDNDPRGRTAFVSMMNTYEVKRPN